MVQQSNRLTSLERVRDWVGSTTSGDDLLLTRLVDSCSRFVLSYLQRTSLYQNTVTDIYDGKGGDQQMLRNFPVVAVSSVIINNQTISPFAVPQVPTTTNLIGVGYVFDPWDGFPPGRPQMVSLRGYRFHRGVSNVSISYTFGFVVQNEAQTLPAISPYTLPANAPNGSWAVDQGVTYASSGIALTPVAYNPATVLNTGQYMASGGVYFFAAGDASVNVFLNYSYVPADVEQAVMEMVGERYAYRTRIGEVSKSLGGQETASFSTKSMPDFVATLLQPYKRLYPVY